MKNAEDIFGLFVKTSEHMWRYFKWAMGTFSALLLLFFLNYCIAWGEYFPRCIPLDSQYGTASQYHIGNVPLLSIPFSASSDLDVSDHQFYRFYSFSSWELEPLSMPIYEIYNKDYVNQSYGLWGFIEDIPDYSERGMVEDGEIPYAGYLAKEKKGLVFVKDISRKSSNKILVYKASKDGKSYKGITHLGTCDNYHYLPSHMREYVEVEDGDFRIPTSISCALTTYLDSIQIRYDVPYGDIEHYEEIEFFLKEHLLCDPNA